MIEKGEMQKIIPPSLSVEGQSPTRDMDKKADEDKAGLAEAKVVALFAKRLIQIGYSSLVCSMLLLTFAGLAAAPWVASFLLMFARTFGIASFLCGAGLLVFERWTWGTVLLISSIVLPVISLALFKTI